MEEQGITEVPLTEKNAIFMESLKQFVKYNPLLIHLDLQTTGLPAQILRMIGYILTRATSLQAIHLCGNPGIDDEMIKWMRKRIKAKQHTEPCSIQPLPKSYKIKGQQVKQAPPKQNSAVMSLFGLGKKPEPEPVDPNKEWKELRAGLKLQSIISSKRMNEVIHASTFEKKRCIITRHIGQKQIIPGAGQWKIITDQREECWFCG